MVRVKLEVLERDGTGQYRHRTRGFWTCTLTFKIISRRPKKREKRQLRPGGQLAEQNVHQVRPLLSFSGFYTFFQDKSLPAD